MKLAFLRKRYDYYSRKTSDIVRKLAFSGIALVWLFRIQIDNQWKVPKTLLLAATLIGLTLVLDFLQYVSGSLVWALYNKLKERAKTPETAEFLAPRSINWPANFFFWTKILSIALAYWTILHFLIDQVLAS